VWGLLLTHGNVGQVAVLRNVRLDHGPSSPRVEAALVGVVALGISLVTVLGRKGVLVC
jgi:hypothetical protein